MDTNTYKSEKQGLKCKPKARDWCALKKKKTRKKQNKTKTHTETKTKKQQQKHKQKWT